MRKRIRSRGRLKKISKKISKSYKKIDKKVGGVLPGGVSISKSKKTIKPKIKSKKIKPRIKKTTKQVSRKSNLKVKNNSIKKINPTGKTIKRPQVKSSRKITKKRTVSRPVNRKIPLKINKPVQKKKISRPVSRKVSRTKIQRIKSRNLQREKVRTPILKRRKIKKIKEDIRTKETLSFQSKGELIFKSPESFAKARNKNTGEKSFTSAVPIKRQNGKILVRDYHFRIDEKGKVSKKEKGEALLNESHFLNRDRSRSERLLSESKENKKKKN